MGLAFFCLERQNRPISSKMDVVLEKYQLLLTIPVFGDFRTNASTKVRITYGLRHLELEGARKWLCAEQFSKFGCESLSSDRPVTVLHGVILKE